MKIVGGSTRSAAYLAVAISTAILILLPAPFAPATAAEVSPADTAAAAALYERATPDSGSTAPAKPASTSATAPDLGTAASSSPSAASTDPDDPAAAASASAPTTPASSAEPSLPPVTTETVVVPASMPAPTYVKHDAGAPASTTEIPQSAGGQVQGGPEPGTAEIDNPAPDDQTMNYLAHQSPQTIDPQLHSLQEFINEGDESSPLGIQLREDQRKLNSGEIANGLLIVGVEKHSAAAVAGLHAFTRTTRNVAEGVAVAASMFFPPAVLAVPLLDQLSFGESYDLIIGVDGARVANYLDFEDRMRDLQPGQIVYLSIVRNGNRVQVPVHVQTLSPAVF